MRPSGPVPVPASVRRSKPAASAIRRAIGLARKRRSSPPAGAAAGSVGAAGGRRRPAASASAAALRRRCLGGRGVGRGVDGDLLALGADDRDRRAQRGRLAVADQDLQQRAVLVGLEVHGRLVGLDLGDHVALVEALALAA